MKYSIYYANMRCVHPEKKTRPVVVVAEQGNRVKVHCVTCRNKSDRPDFYVPLNHYMISGNVEVKRSYWIDKKFLLDYVKENAPMRGVFHIHIYICYNTILF